MPEYQKPNIWDVFGTINPLLRIIPPLAALGRPPQGQNEPNVVAGARKAVTSPFVNMDEGVRAVGQDVAKSVDYGLQTPAQVKAEQGRTAHINIAPGAKLPERFDDPAYDAAEQKAAQITGVPVELLRSIRMNGERSNASQVSTAGARTPYQVIPGTRQGLIKNYKVDPWKDADSAALGAAYTLWEQAGRPAPGQWGAQQIQRAAGGYFGGAAGAANPFGTLSDGGTTVGNYVQRVLGPNTGLAAPFMAANPANPFQGQALGELNTAQRAALQPFSTTMQRPPMPEMPAPTPGVKTDFSQANAWLEDMKPQPMGDYDRLKMERRGWFAGLAQGLANSPEGAGIGKLFAMMGGGALAGRMEAQDKLQQLDDRFEQRLALWKQAMFQNNFQEAQIHSGEAQRDIDNMDKYALNQWSTNVQQWRADNNVTMQGDALVSTSADANGNLVVNRIPVASAVNSAFALRRAELYSGMGNQFNQGQQMIAQANNSLVGSYAGAMLSQSLASGNGADAAAAAAAAPAMYATHIAETGKVAEIVGEEGAKSLNERVDQRLLQLGLFPGSKEYSEKKQFMVAEELTNLSLLDPSYFPKMQKAARAADLFRAADRYYGRRETTATDSRGRVSTRTVFDSEGL